MEKKIVEEAISYIEVKDYDNASRVLEELKNDLED